MTIEELLNSYFQCDAKVSEQLDTTETDSEGEGTIPDAGMLNEIFETGECSVTTDYIATEEPYGLCEMTTESLITIWERYVSQAKCPCRQLFAGKDPMHNRRG